MLVYRRVFAWLARSQMVSKPFDAFCRLPVNGWLAFPSKIITPELEIFASKIIENWWQTPMLIIINHA